MYFFLAAVFHLSTVGSNTSTLWAEEAGLYLGIDNRGNIVTTVSSLFETQVRFVKEQIRQMPDFQGQTCISIY